jgi:uncharacterized membrane protein
MFGLKSEDANSQERPGFKGFYRRSLINDNLNTVHFENYKRFFKQLYSILLCFGVLGVYYVLIVLLFYFCSFLADRDAETNWSSYPVTVPALMNVVLLQVFDPIYSTLADQLTQQENHVSFSEFEGNYISKLFMFKFLSICGPILMINYINSLAGLTCV